MSFVVVMAHFAIIVTVSIMAFGWATGTLNDYLGGFHWQALVMAVWEAFLVVGVYIGSFLLSDEPVLLNLPGSSQ